MLVSVNINEKCVLFSVVTKRMEIFSNVIHSSWNRKGSKKHQHLTRQLTSRSKSSSAPVGRETTLLPVGAGPAHCCQHPLKKESRKHREKQEPAGKSEIERGCINSLRTRAAKKYLSRRKGIKKKRGRKWAEEAVLNTSGFALPNWNRLLLK